MGLAATHLLAYVITGRYQFSVRNSTTDKPLADEVHNKSDINWLTHQVPNLMIYKISVHKIIFVAQMVTVAVASLLFIRCVLFAKVGKSCTDTSNSTQDVQDTAVVAEPVDPKVNNTSTMIQSKMANGILNGSVSGLKCNMGTGVIPSHASVENLLANRKEYLKASIDSGKAPDDIASSSSEESDPGNEIRSLAECTALLKAPVS